MSIDFFDDAVFFFGAKRRKGAFQKFCDRFSLTLSEASGTFEVTDPETGRILHEADSLDDLIKYLDADPQRCFDFYLVDPGDTIFTFSYRPEGYHVISLPYGSLDEETLQKTLVSFDAIYGWGAGENAPPPDSLEEMKAAAGALYSPFIRYHNGQIVAGNMPTD